MWITNKDITIKCCYRVIGKVNITISTIETCIIGYQWSMSQYMNDILGHGLLTFDKQEAH
jgi:hypothetical protein